MKHFDHEHSNAFDLLTCTAVDGLVVRVAPTERPHRPIVDRPAVPGAASRHRSRRR
jgi:hypothetical protein